MSKPRLRDGRRHLAPMPDGRAAPFLAVHNPAAERAHSLMLAVLIVTPYAQCKKGLTPEQGQMVALAHATVMQAHLSGRFPAPSGSAWVDPISGQVTPFEMQSSAWLNRMVQDHLSCATSVPIPQRAKH